MSLAILWHPEPQAAIYVIGILLDVQLVPIYVGRSAYPERRWWQHQHDCHSELLAWRLRRNRELGNNVVFRVVAWCSKSEAPALEAAWLKRVLDAGWSPANYGPWNARDRQEIQLES